MATHSSVLAWRIPGMGEPGGLPGGLPPGGSLRVGHDLRDLAAAAEASTPDNKPCSYSLGCQVGLLKYLTFNCKRTAHDH